MRRLVVCDAHDASWIDRAAAQAQPGTEWDLLLLGVSGVAFRQKFAHDLARLGQWRIVDVETLAPQAHERVDAFVLDLVWKLPGAPLGTSTLGALLEYDAGNLWWSLEVTEKSPFRGMLIERLYRLALVEAAVHATEYADAWVRVADPMLRPIIAGANHFPPVHVIECASGPQPRIRAFALLYWLRAIKTLLHFGAARAVIAAAGWRVPRPANGGLAIFTCYPYWWLAPFAASASDRFFSDPTDHREPYYAAWLMWPRELWANRAAAARVIASRRIVPLQLHVRWREALTVLSPRRFSVLRRARREVRRHLQVAFGSYDISRIVRDEIAGSMADVEIFVDRLLHLGLAALARERAPAALLYRAEMQPWEHALLTAMPSSVPAIGFLHSPFGPNYLPMRFAPGELAASDQGAGAKPLPGSMMVCGTAARAYLERDGYPPAQIARCGPQRHVDFVRFLAARTGRAALRDTLGLPRDRPIYYVAIAIVEVETEGLFASIEEALDQPFAGTAPSHLLVKTHPNRPAGDEAMRRAMAALGDARTSFVPAAGNMYEYLGASDAMICIGSTVAFEAMALGVMPVVYEHPGTFAATSLRAFESALYVVSSPGGLRAALEEIARDGAGARARRASWPETLAQVFGDLVTPLPQQLDAALAQLGAPGR